MSQLLDLHRWPGRDRRLEAAELRAGQLERPVIGVENVLNDGETEPGPFAALVEPCAAFEYGRQLVGRDPAAIVLDDDRRTAAGPLNLAAARIDIDLEKTTL